MPNALVVSFPSFGAGLIEAGGYGQRAREA